jgi:CobQ-like glutamine amidotransferase family enzyme
MEIVQIRITSTVVTAPYGTLMPGTILRTSPAYAKHLVEEACAAKYLEALPEDEPAPEQNDAPAQKRAKKQTETDK